MGSQQLMLLVLGVIIVGVAIAVGINYFRMNSIEEKRDLLANECATLANQAIAYYKKPSSFGGGGGSFIGWQIPVQQRSTPSGTFSATIYQDSVIINGTGNEVANNTDSIRVRTTILSDGFSTAVIN